MKSFDSDVDVNLIRIIIIGFDLIALSMFNHWFVFQRRDFDRFLFVGKLFGFSSPPSSFLLSSLYCHALHSLLYFIKNIVEATKS